MRRLAEALVFTTALFAASAVFPILLFYELTELRPLPDALERIQRWDAEMRMWRLFQRPAGG